MSFAAGLEPHGMKPGMGLNPFLKASGMGFPASFPERYVFHHPLGSQFPY